MNGEVGKVLLELRVKGKVGRVGVVRKPSVSRSDCPSRLCRTAELICRSAGRKAAAAGALKPSIPVADWQEGGYRHVIARACVSKIYVHFANAVVFCRGNGSDESAI